MSSISNTPTGQDPWAVLLAGGDGTRLQSLTLKIAGDSRPKQFCRIFGDKSLLLQTEDRVAPMFRPSQTVYLVTEAHHEYYREDLREACEDSIYAQPRNRGTGVAIAMAILRISRRDPDGLVAFFPCDHYYANDAAFARTANSAIAFARRNPQSIILVGSRAHYPEVEYGWIETGLPVQEHGDNSLFSVNRFWEKPSLQTAQVLLSQGCLWNTFVTVGHVKTFLEMMHSQMPEVMSWIDAGITCNALDWAYSKVRPVDFSTEVLARLPHRLLAVRDADSGWTDFGNAARVIDTLVQNRIEPAWLAEMRQPGTAASRVNSEGN